MVYNNKKEVKGNYFVILFIIVIMVGGRFCNLVVLCKSV